MLAQDIDNVPAIQVVPQALRRLAFPRQQLRADGSAVALHESRIHGTDFEVIEQGLAQADGLRVRANGRFRIEARCIEQRIHVVLAISGNDAADGIAGLIG